MTTTEALRALRAQATAFVKALDLLIEADTTVRQTDVEIPALPRTKAIEWVLDETGAVMRANDVWNKLAEEGRTDPKDEVSITLADLAKRKRIENVARGEYRAWQRDEEDVPSQMLLHEAMSTVLYDQPGRSMHPRDLAAEIDVRELYRRKDGKPIPAGQIRSRAFRHPELFGKDGLRVTLV